MIRRSGNERNAPGSLPLFVLPVRGDIGARFVQMHVLIDMIDPRDRNEVVVLAIGWAFLIWGMALYLWSGVLYLFQVVLVVRRG